MARFVSCRWHFLVYRLALDTKTDWVRCSRLKISELAQGFSDGYSIDGSSETFCIKRKGLISVFVY
ncbi:MAG: hypothetical protein KBT29_03525 [Prevotellaceae bacterium]|nr:hypothetical protein [Candidatus Minthosoma caballi]